MLVVYTDEKTYIRSEFDYDLVETVYGAKLAAEAYEKLKNAPVGFSFRKNGGPLLKIVSKQDAAIIREKELKIGMLAE